MTAERRRQPRYMALLKATGRVGDTSYNLVCSNVGPSGAFFACRTRIPLQSRLRVTVRAPGHNAPYVQLVSEVVRHTPDGVGVKWLQAESASGVEPLRAVMRSLLRLNDIGEIDRSVTRSVTFDFERLDQPPPPEVSRNHVQSAPLAPKILPASPPVATSRGFSAPPPPVSSPGLRVDTVAAGRSPFEAREAARRGAGLQSFPLTARDYGPGQGSASSTPRYGYDIPADMPPVPVPLPPPVVVPRPAASVSLQLAPLDLPDAPLPPRVPRVAPPPVTRPAPAVAVAAMPVAVKPPAPRVAPPVAPRAATFVMPPPLDDAPAPGRATQQRPESSIGSQVSSSMGGFALPRVAPVPADDRSMSWPVGVPRSLSERYADFTLLGQGGHGVVFRARDLLLDRHVVLKFLAGTGMAPEPARRYFLREFKVSADLLHPNIVRLYDIGSADGTLYYTMEYVPGAPLGRYLEKNQRIDDNLFTYSVFAQLAAALDYAHSKEVLHRDVKPNNVLVAEDGSVRLFDFGLARLLSDGGRDQSMVVGTPFYMAPEMQRTAPIDGRADQYALGVVLFRMLTGRVPFADGNVFLAHAVAPVPDPRVFHAELPAAISPILNRMLAKLPQDRYENCSAAAAELFEVLGGPAGVS